MGVFEQFPYSNFHELNADWLIKELLKLKTSVEQFVAINALKYADPIQWNITRQYEKNTIVIDPLTGTAYISVQPVPSGVALTRTEYWTVVFDLGSFVVRAAKNFTDNFEEDTTLTATFPSAVNDWLIWGDTLYRVISNIVAGDQYVVGSNIQHFTIEDVIGHLEDLTTADKSNIVAAINEVVSIIGSLTDLTTEDNSNIVAAINEVVDNLTALTRSVSDIQDFIGSGTLETTAQTLIGGINELNNDVKDILYKMSIEPSPLTANIILDAVLDAKPWLQGSCYCGNGKIVSYFYNTNSDTGLLRCFDSINFSILWEHAIKGYHGNALCYNPNTGDIYIAGYTTYDNTRINKIVKTNIESPTILSEIDCPINTFSIGYDISTNKFYGVESIAASSQGKKLYMFSDEFITIENEITIELLNVDAGLGQGQGFNCIHNGIIYNIVSVAAGKYLFANDITSGKNIFVAEIPRILNHYRDSGEIEALTYDYDNERFIMCCATSGIGVTDKAVYTFAEIGIFNEVIEYVPSIMGITTTDFTEPINAGLENGCTILRPVPFSTTRPNRTFKCFSDIMNLNRWLRHSVRIVITTSLSGSTNIIDGVYLRGNNFQNIGSCIMRNIYSMGNNDCQFRDVTFDSFIEFDSYGCNLQTGINDTFKFLNCTFSDFTSSKTHISHILVNNGSIVIDDGGNTYEGTNSRFYHVLGGISYPETFFKQTTISGSNVTSIANSYVKALTFDVTGQSLVYATSARANSNTEGYIITNTDNLTDTENRVLQYEVSGSHAAKTPVVVLLKGTYYLWVKKVGAVTFKGYAIIREMPTSLN